MISTVHQFIIRVLMISTSVHYNHKKTIKYKETDRQADRGKTERFTLSDDQFRRDQWCSYKRPSNLNVRSAVGYHTYCKFCSLATANCIQILEKPPQSSVSFSEWSLGVFSCGRNDERGLNSSVCFLWNMYVALSRGIRQSSIPACRRFWMLYQKSLVMGDVGN